MGAHFDECCAVTAQLGCWASKTLAVVASLHRSTAGCDTHTVQMWQCLQCINQACGGWVTTRGGGIVSSADSYAWVVLQGLLSPTCQIPILRFCRPAVPQFDQKGMLGCRARLLQSVSWCCWALPGFVELSGDVLPTCCSLCWPATIPAAQMA
jgi:hypothetical protein